MNRAHYNDEERAAAALLDRVKDGEDICPQEIHRALWVLGDAVGSRP